MNQEITLEEAMKVASKTTDNTMRKILPSNVTPWVKLFDAMHWSALGDGKKLRPFLVLQTAIMFDVSYTESVRCASALELVHSYSLVHDDLPAMDNASLRRGKASTHKKFDEATAILAGDALLTLAFEVLADEQTHADVNIRMELVKSLARASGGHDGMIAGQVLDMISEGQELDESTLNTLQDMKTGALINSSVEFGAIIGRASEEERTALKKYSSNLGLAFQITDDILDVIGDTKITGKEVGNDVDNNKATYVSILGLDKAKKHAQFKIDEAVKALTIFGDRAKMLCELAYYILNRQK